MSSKRWQPLGIESGNVVQRISGHGGAAMRSEEVTLKSGSSIKDRSVCTTLFYLDRLNLMPALTKGRHVEEYNNNKKKKL